MTDFRGKVLSFDKPVRRVVSLLESATSGLFMLHAEQTLVGISSNIYGHSLYPYYSLLDERIKNRSIPAPGNWDFVSLESVVGLRPDLVIIWSSQSESIEALESHDIPVYAIMLNGVDDIYKEIQDFGTLLDRRPRADSIIGYTKDQIASISRSSGIPLSVYFMWSSGIFETAGLRSTVNNFLEASGCRNACQSEQEHVSVNAEILINWNPGIILLWNNDALDPSDVMRQSTLRTLDAVGSGKVYELPGVFECDLWTLKYQYAVQFLNHAAYGKSFDAESIRMKRDSMMTFLYGHSF